MFGGLALSSATPNTCPTWAAVTVNGLGVASTCACGGAPGAWRLKMRVDGPLGSMNVWSPGSVPGVTWAGCGAPEKPVTTASPDCNTAAGVCARAVLTGSTAASSAIAASAGLNHTPRIPSPNFIEEDAKRHRLRAPAVHGKLKKITVYPPASS